MNDKNMEFIYKVISNIPEEKKEDIEFLEKVEATNPDACDMLLDAPELKENKEFAIKSMKTQLADKVYDHLVIELKSDDDVILAALSSRVIEPEEKKEEAPMFFKVEPHDEEVVEKPEITFEEKKEEAPMSYGEEVKEETPKADETAEVEEQLNTTYPNFDELLPKAETVENTEDFAFKNNNESYVAEATQEGMYAPNSEVVTTPTDELPSLDEVTGSMPNLNEMYSSTPAFGGYQNVQEGESLIR